MPYFIEQVASGWNTVKDDGTILGKHKTKKQAIDQMVAVSLAEKIPVGGERAVKQIGISDFDDTLYVAGGLNQAVYDFIDSQDVDLFVVTGRHESDRDATTALLNKLNVDYSRLIMQPNDQNDSATYKGATASRLLADGLDVKFVVENNAEARKAYKDAGVDMVLNPSDLPAVDGVRQMEDMQMEDVPVTKEMLMVQLEEMKGDVLELVGKLVETVSNLSDLVEGSDQVTPSSDVPPVDPSMVQEDSVRYVDPATVAEFAKRGERVSKGIEQRIAFHDLEIRAESDGMTLRGYAAVFDSPSQPLPFIETIQQGAFRDSLKSRNDVKLLWNHDTNIVLGSTRAGTLKLGEDQRGLFVEATLPDTQAGRDAVVSIQRGDVTGFSFGFRVPVGGDEWMNANERVLKRVNIHEVSVGVAFPAYLGTEGTATVRSVSELTDKIIKLAEIRGVSAEELTDALLALESGEELTERQGELLTDTLNKVLQKDPEVTNPQALLDLKKKQLDLLMQRV